MQNSSLESDTPSASPARGRSRPIGSGWGRRSLSVVVWARTLRDTCSPIWNGIGSDKRLTLHPLLVGFHQATWRGFYTRKDSRNGQTFSSLTGRTSGLPVSVTEGDSRRPAIPAAGSALRSHPCGAVSAAQVLPV